MPIKRKTNTPSSGFRPATDKQVRYIIYLLKRLGYNTKYVNSGYKKLGAGAVEYGMPITEWLGRRDIAEASAIIDKLLDELKKNEGS